MDRSRLSKSQRVFHYTTRLRLRDIVRDGFINPAKMHVESTEKPAVWCSTNPFWERTVFKGIRRPNGTIVDLTRDELAEEVGLGRIEVSQESAPFDWRYHKLHSGIQPELARGMVISAKRRHANPLEWRVSYRPIPATEWLAIESWDREHDLWLPLGR